MLPFFEDEPKLSEDELAWFGGDWAKVKAIADSYKEKPESVLFKILNNINVNKQDISVQQFEGYSKFMIDKMLGQHIDCLYPAFTANLLMSGVSDQMHHDYLVLSVPYGRRFSKSIKLSESHKDKYIINLLMAYYKVNAFKAYEYKELLAHKGKLDVVLKNAKALATDDFLKGITKNPKEIKELKAL